MRCFRGAGCPGAEQEGVSVSAVKLLKLLAATQKAEKGALIPCTHGMCPSGRFHRAWGLLRPTFEEAETA